MRIDGSQDGGWILRTHKSPDTDEQAALWVMIDGLVLPCASGNTMVVFRRRAEDSANG